MPTILISGAGIAGSVLSWWLSRAGWSCTIVERDATPRLTGQQVDLRGAGRTIVHQMGLVDAIREATVKEKGVAFVDEHGYRHASIPAGHDGQGGGLSADIEILRGELAAVCVRAAEKEENVRIVYGDRIVGLKDTPDGVDVTFASGEAWGGKKNHMFDVVVAADGMHSSTRKLMFPEYDGKALHPLGQYIAFFTIPIDPVADADAWASWSNAPGGRLIFVRPDLQRNRTGGHLGVCGNEEGDRLFANYHKLSVTEQKRTWKALFAETIKEHPLAARVVAGMDTPEANDFYMSDIAQVKLPAWTKGRMALVGDAAACPSPISGMGSTVAIVGAYYLALELAKHPKDVQAGLRAYEAAMRPVVDKAQKLAAGAPKSINPQTRWGITVFYTIMRFLAWTGLLVWFEGNAATDASVPEFPVVKAA